jgi:hypothetical protein
MQNYWIHMAEIRRDIQDYEKWLAEAPIGTTIGENYLIGRKFVVAGHVCRDLLSAEGELVDVMILGL